MLKKDTFLSEEKSRKQGGEDSGEKRSFLSRPVSLGNLGRGKNLPVKRTINLAEIGVRKTDPKVAAGGIILIILAAAVFSKFLVTDRLFTVFHAQNEATRLQQELDRQYARISSYGEIENEYAHYTYSGMTEEELSLVDRSEIIQMLEKELGKDNTATVWSLSGNVLTLTATGKDLQEINLLAGRLETYDVVNMCSVTEAVKEETKGASVKAASNASAAPDTGEEAIVRANITAYLQAPTVAEEAGSANADSGASEEADK